MFALLHAMLLPECIGLWAAATYYDEVWHHIADEKDKVTVNNQICPYVEMGILYPPEASKPPSCYTCCTSYRATPAECLCTAHTATHKYNRKFHLPDIVQRRAPQAL